MRRAELVRLFEYEPDLLAALPEPEARTALERTVVECATLAPGLIGEPVTPAPDLGFLVLEGVLLHRVEFLGRRAVELVGPGDLLRPWRPADGSATLSLSADWKVCERARLAVLDARFERDVAGWPGVVGLLLDRLDRKSVV